MSHLGKKYPTSGGYDQFFFRKNKVGCFGKVFCSGFKSSTAYEEGSFPHYLPGQRGN